MQVRRGACGVSGGADVAEDGLRGDVSADSRVGRVRVEVRVIVCSPARAEDEDGVAAERAFAHAHHVAFCSRADGGSARGEDVLPFV